MPPLLSIRGHITIEIDRQPPIHVICEHDLIIIDMQRIPDFPSRERVPKTSAASKASGGRGAGRRETIERVDQLLRRHGVTLEARIAGRVIARLGPAARPSFSAALLGLGPLELHSAAAIKALLHL